MGRLAVGFILDVVAIARGRRDLLDALLLATIVQANTQPLAARAEAATAASDEGRRPVSVNALAASLKLPFETVRRRVRRLALRRLCRTVDGGVIVPARVLASPEYLKSSFQGYERMRAFYYDLKGLGFLAALPPPSVELGAELAPLGAVTRIATDYVLRVVDTIMTTLGDPLEGLILLMVLRCNTEHFSAEQRGGAGADAEDFVADDLRRPARVSEVARRLGLPGETVRRHAAALIHRGLCARTAEGLVVPAEALARPAFIALMGENLSNLQRMFGGLSQLGVLQAWDDLDPRADAPGPAPRIPQNG